jgi:prepilin-type processing-associated H-X9-DG protein
MFSWISVMMPYLEEASLYGQVDWTKPLGERYDATPPDKSHHIQFASYTCPSSEPVEIVNNFYGARGNYAGNVGIGTVWMNDTSPTQDCAYASLNTSYGCMPHKYWFNAPKQNPEAPNSSLSRFGTFMVNKGRKMSEFEDGTSKTAAVSELLTIPGTADDGSSNGDTRGVMHFGAGSMYMHDFPPNYVDSNQVNKDQTRYCVANDVAPCKHTDFDWKGDWQHTARSAHNGGVNMMMVDTSVRFVSDDIDLDTWKAMSTPRGGEVVSSGI